MKERVRFIFITSGITLILISLYLVIYYNVILQNHTGSIDSWVIFLLIVPAILMCVSRVIIELNGVDINERNFLNKIFLCISELILIPFILIYLVAGIFIFFNGFANKKPFKKLIDKGFIYKYKNFILYTF